MRKTTGAGVRGRSAFIELENLENARRAGKAKYTVFSTTCSYSLRLRSFSSSSFPHPFSASLVSALLRVLKPDATQQCQPLAPPSQDDKDDCVSHAPC